MDLDSIHSRIKDYIKSKNDKNIDNLLDISANDFNNRKRRNTLLPVIIEWATNGKVSLDWIVYGTEKKNPEDSIKETALTMLKNSSEKSKNTDR